MIQLGFHLVCLGGPICCQFAGARCFALRKGFCAASVPVMLSGIGGPGAPHYFEFQRRENFGCEAMRFSKFVLPLFSPMHLWGSNSYLWLRNLWSQGCDNGVISDPYWKVAAADSHKADVVMRFFGRFGLDWHCETISFWLTGHFDCLWCVCQTVQTVFSGHWVQLHNALATQANFGWAVSFAITRRRRYNC